MFGILLIVLVIASLIDRGNSAASEKKLVMEEDKSNDQVVNQLVNEREFDHRYNWE